MASRPVAVIGNYAERPPRDPSGPPWIRGYPDALSYAPGDTMAVHVSTNADRYRLTLTREPADGALMFDRGDLPGAFHATPADCSATGCGWPCAIAIELGADWPSGAYRLTLATDPPGPSQPGTSQQGDRYEHTVIIRPDRTTARRGLLLVAATASWTAYNDWGGSNAYDGVAGPTGDQFSPILSIHRPQARGFAALPDDAPRVTLAEPPGLLAPIRYPHMEWAYAHGYSKKYASSGWASYERHFADWAAAEGYPLDVVAQTDLQLHPELLELYRCVVFVGHDEYWSWEMRDAVDRFVDRGGRAARFAGNFLWQIRLEHGGASQVCYKHLARTQDPLRDTPRVSTMWEAEAVGRPGSSTFGLDATRGVYAGWGGCVSRGCGGFPVYRPEHWAFAGTGLGYGDVLGAESHVFGYEVDGLDYVICHGLPYPAEPEKSPAGLQILALGLASLFEEGDGVDPGLSWLTRDDAHMLVSELAHGDLERIKRGSGMIVHFPRGRGEVFHAGSCEWVAGLLRRDPFVMQVTRNVLDRFLA